MRQDAVGFFWNDTPPPKPPKKEKEKRTPPRPVWLEPDYLPGLEEALRFPVRVMTEEELVQAALNREQLIVDVEIYKNYFLVVFTSLSTGAVFYLEEWSGGPPLNRNLLGWILTSFTTIGFNSINYDTTILQLALVGYGPEDLKIASDAIIVEEIRGYEVLRQAKVKPIKIDHIDLIEVAPLFGSLKAYGARLHVPKLQDLPFHPATVLSGEQMVIVRWYCVNDTVVTAYLYEHLKEHIELRIQFGEKYNADFRSLSDAQMAEAVIKAELKKVTGKVPPKPKKGQSVGQQFYYRPPPYIMFSTPELKEALREMSSALIVVGESGHAQCPKEIRDRIVVIGGKKYKVGMGGLHSQEKSQAIVAGNGWRCFDRDVTGYYPNLILKNRFAPPQLGQAFLTAFQGMVDRRTDAKRVVAILEKENTDPNDKHFKSMKSEADGLKISNNGIFGKLSDPFSVVYDVPNMVQVTITGQLSLLMIIEMLEHYGFPVVSANTDGIVVMCHETRVDEMNALFTAWEQHTGLETEETEYAALYSANVNNYIAVKPDGKTKTKGWYCERGSAHNSVLSKNPETLICSDAVQAYLAKSTPISDTIRNCRDIRRFVSVRQVSGGGVKIWDDDHIEFLGKTIRWYYAKDIPGEIVYARSGNKVPRTEGAKPLMQLPAELPSDIDFEWYEEKAFRILKDIGAVT